MNFHKKHFFDKIKLNDKFGDRLYNHMFPSEDHVKKLNLIVIVLWVISFIIVTGVLVGQVVLFIC